MTHNPHKVFSFSIAHLIGLIMCKRTGHWSVWVMSTTTTKGFSFACLFVFLSFLKILFWLPGHVKRGKIRGNKLNLPAHFYPWYLDVFSYSNALCECRVHERNNAFWSLGGKLLKRLEPSTPSCFHVSSCPSPKWPITIISLLVVVMSVR